MPEQSPLEIYVAAPPTECDANQASGSQASPGGTGPSTCEAATELFGSRSCRGRLWFDLDAAYVLWSEA